MAVSVGTLTAGLELDLSGLTAGIAKASRQAQEITDRFARVADPAVKAMEAAESAASDASRGIAEIGRSADRAGTSLSAMVARANAAARAASEASRQTAQALAQSTNYVPSTQPLFAGAQKAAGGMRLARLQAADAAGAAAATKLADEINRAHEEAIRLNREMEKDTLRRALTEQAKEAESMQRAMERALGGIPRKIGEAGAKLAVFGNSVRTVFGEEGPRFAREFGDSIRESLGLGEEQVAALQSGVTTLSASLQAAGAAAALLSGPVLAAAAAVAGLTGAAGALRLAYENNLGGIRQAFDDLAAKAREAWAAITGGGENDSSEAAFAGRLAAIDKRIGEMKAAGKLDEAAKMAASREKFVRSFYADTYDESTERSALFYREQARVVEAEIAALKEKASLGAEELRQLAAKKKLLGDLLRAAQSAPEVDMGSSGFSFGLESFKAALGPVGEALAPGQSAADATRIAREQEQAAAARRKAILDATEEMAIERDYAVRDRMEAEAEIAKREAQRAKEIEDQNERNARELKAISEKQMGDFRKSLDGLVEEMKRAEEKARAAAQARTPGAILGRAGDALASRTLSSSGTFGAVVGAATSKEAMAGGAFGVATAASVELLMQSQQFREVAATLGTIMQIVADTLGRVLAPINPLLRVVGDLVSVLMGTLAPVFDLFASALRPVTAVIWTMVPLITGLTPAINALFAVLNGPLWLAVKVLDGVMWILYQQVRFLGIAVLGVVAGLAWAWNEIVQAMMDLASYFGLEDLAEWLGSLKANQNKVKQGIKDLWETDYGEALQAGIEPVPPALDDLTRSVRAATEAFTNVPTGYRTGLSLYNAQGVAGEDGSGYIRPFATGGLVTRPTIGLVGEAGPEAVIPLNSAQGRALGGGTTIVANFYGVTNARDLWRDLKRLMERDAVVETGSIIPPAAPYLARST